jgi:hypothetical protein
MFCLASTTPLLNCLRGMLEPGSGLCYQVSIEYSIMMRAAEHLRRAAWLR